GTRSASMDGNSDRPEGPPVVSLCPRCSERAERKLKEGFDKFWEAVPRIFGEEKWEVLYASDV
ncbi:hypothetical protein HDZ31DRAFT_8181, partial [Schizophyllum fasciatum]